MDRASPSAVSALILEKKNDRYRWYADVACTEGTHAWSRRIRIASAVFSIFILYLGTTPNSLFLYFLTPALKRRRMRICAWLTLISLARPGAARTAPVRMAVVAPLSDAPSGAAPADVALDGPLTGPQRVRRALTFWSRVVPILGAYKVAEVALDTGAASALVSIGLVPEAAAARASAGDREAVFQALHEWGSVRLEETIQELKGFYVKTGQVISTRVDLFPEQYTSRLASLQDSLDPMPAEVRRGAGPKCRIVRAAPARTRGRFGSRV
eukprot:scaffold1050_cov130-Isochrysis_galbana.AAC.1